MTPLSWLSRHPGAILASLSLFVLGVAIGFGGSSARERTTTLTKVVTKVVTEPPTQEGVYVDYGQYPRYVRLIGLQWHLEGSSVGGGRVFGQAEYLGGLGCRVLRHLEITGTLFNEKSTAVETLRRDMTKLPAKSRVPLVIHHKSVLESGRVELFVARADC
jgi:hypothetical protein